MESIKGMISNILYKNSDNGYTIANLKTKEDTVTIVGCMPTISLGETIEVQGNWVKHKTYGMQLKIESFLPATPSSVDGILAYLSSGMIKGIGEKMAQRIVDKFGLDTLMIIQMNPDKLTTIDGIGKKKAEQIGKSFDEHRELRNIIIHLSKYGISPAYCLKIYKKYKNKAIDMINQNPYRLADDIRGIGFKIADNIAQNMGIDKNSVDRIKQGILYTLKQALTGGHTYLQLNDLINKSADVLEINKDNIQDGIVELAIDARIQIEPGDSDQNVYLTPFYIAENGTCMKLIEFSQCEFEDTKIDIDKEIESIEKENNINLASKQKQAVKLAMSEGVVVITGGPGTGKTTTINTIIQMFERQQKEVILAAPTGRAAKRMSETSGYEAKTIHRLLEMGYSDDDEGLAFSKNEEDKLEADVIIIDEVSMVDILLMYNLLKAVREKTRLILVGDSDQLPSVGAGNVLGDIINSECIKVVRLDEIFRQAKESMIVVNAHKINKGELPILNSKDNDFFFIKKTESEDILSEIVEVVSRRLPKFYKADKLKDIQVLSPMRKSDVGVFNLNAYLQNALNPADGSKIEENFLRRIFRVGDKVMQTKNNYNKKWKNEDESEKGEGVYNGDIGYIYHIDKQNKNVYVIFEEYKIVTYDYNEVDELEHSFCTTIHKSQGSEFPVVVMPIAWAPPMLLTRNLLYTGITRAKKLVVLIGDTKYLDFMIKNNKIHNRNSGLSRKLKMFLKEGILVDEKV